ncbi:MAG: class I SAM-dependent methyltransferase [Chloroflexota bacterium]
MTSDDRASQIIQEALSLDGTPNTLKQFYAKWADDYDTDVAHEHYAAPQIMVDMLQALNNETTLNIIDAGCGTGLVGDLLYQQGYRQIDGFDLSPDMVQIAETRGVYNQLRGNIDLTQPLANYDENSYDVAFCCGVFTLGHVSPTALNQLIYLVRPGGYILVSTRVSYYGATDYQAVSDALEQQGLFKRVTFLPDTPYTDDGLSHYWGYQVS